MTNDFKDITMEYFTGNLPIQQSPQQVYFEQYKTTKNNFQTELDTIQFPYGYTIDGKVQGKSRTNEGLEYSVYYGKYKRYSGDNYYRSYIMIVNEKNNIVQVIKRYSNNEEIGVILGLNVGKDGRFFALELDSNGYYRFVLMNNIIAKLPSQEEYTIVQRQTYRVSDQQYFVNVYHVEIEKHPESARYVIFGFHTDGVLEQTRCVEFVINVGSTNEWNYVGENTSYFVLENFIYTYHVFWNDQNQFKIRIIGLNNSTYQGLTSISHTEFEKSFNDTNFNWYEWFPVLINNVQASSIKYKQVIYKSDSETYFSLYVGNKYYLYLYNDVAGTTTKFLEIEMPTPSNIQGIHLLEENGNVFYIYQNGSTPYVGVLVGTTMYSTECENFTIDKTLLLENIQSVFNLYTVYVQSGDYINVMKIPYIDKTNNQSYINTTSLVPYFAKLYDENNDLIFARTLYNKYVSGQTTTSTVEIPNQYLNNTTISNEKLIGKTYCDLIDDDEVFEKNQYEEVFVNFANTLNMINQNDIDNPVINIAGATRVNQTISNTNDYIDSIAKKFKVNYADGTYIIGNFSNSQIELVPGETRKYRYSWQVFNPQVNEILSIDIMSADGKTIYQHITDLGLELGKLYTLTQDVYMV